jgi:hypothetical protein
MKTSAIIAAFAFVLLSASNKPPNTILLIFRWKVSGFCGSGIGSKMVQCHLEKDSKTVEAPAHEIRIQQSAYAILSGGRIERPFFAFVGRENLGRFRHGSEG